jgi:hypothetical protein
LNDHNNKKSSKLCRIMGTTEYFVLFNDIKNEHDKRYPHWRINIQIRIRDVAYFSRILYSIDSK